MSANVVTLQQYLSRPLIPSLSYERSELYVLYELYELYVLYCVVNIRTLIRDDIITM